MSHRRGQSVGDAEGMRRLGYVQELSRRMGGFSNYAISMSIICILAGGVTSFHLGYSSVGGASIGVGWPVVWLFSLTVAATMAQLASAFPTAGGLYHWASILGGRGWGWGTAWFNLAGLVTLVAAINVGTYAFAVDTLGPAIGLDPRSLGPGPALAIQFAAVGLITGSQAAVNHLGIGLVTRLTDFNGYWILLVAAALTVGLLAFATGLDPSRLVRFANYSGPPGGDVWPRTEGMFRLFALGALLPAYVLTGFDASAHAAEETVDAAVNVPRGIVRSVFVSGLAGWVLLAAVVLAMPDPDRGAAQGERAFAWTMGRVLPGGLSTALALGIVVAQYNCGLATVTSASRMAYAFARDGGLPFSSRLRRVGDARRTPAVAIWTVSAAAIAFTAYTPVYSTITAVCTVFLYISYILPTLLGLVVYRRSWTAMGPWDLGAWYRPMAMVCLAGCSGLLVVGVQPPNGRAGPVVIGMVGVLVVGWFGIARGRFLGPPQVRARDE